MRLLVLASANVIHTRRWVAWFLERGHEVILATLEPSGEDRHPEEHVLPARSSVQAFQYLLAAPALARLVRKFRPQLVNAHFVSGYGFLAALVPSARPLAISAWGSDILLNPEKSRLHRFRTRFALRAARLVTCDAENLSGALQGLGVGSSRILEVPMGVDPRLFYPADKETFVQIPGERHPLRIVSTRRLEPVYDIETLLRAAVVLKGRGLDFRIEIADQGSDRARLENFRDESDLKDRVRFTGELSQAELAGVLREADIYVSASLSDSTSVSLLEAMACGIFPVVTDIAGNRQWVVQGRNGLTFPPGDFCRLAECLDQAVKDSDLRLKAREANIELIRRKALWEDNMRLVEKRFLELAGV